MSDYTREKLTVRPYRHGEEEQMAALVNASLGEEEGILVTADMIRDEWGDARLNIARDTAAAVTESGRYIAATEVWFEEPEEDEQPIRHIGFTMHPEYRDDHATLMEELFRQAVQHASRRGPGMEGPLTLRTWASAQDRWKQDWIRAHGFESVHCGYTLLHDSSSTLPPLPTVEGVRLETGAAERAYDLWQALNSIFDPDEDFSPFSWEEWKEAYLHSKQTEPALWRVAVDEESEEIVGLVFTEIDDIAPDIGSPNEGWITDLGVREGWRHRGVGQALLVAALHALRGAGVRATLLGVDLVQPEKELELYESVGFRVLRGSCTFHRVI